MNGKTIEDRLTRLECELRDLKTRVKKLDGIPSNDYRRPEWARMDHRGLNNPEKKNPEVPYHPRHERGSQ